ncbi:Conserved_hypothetical protein [Hexamita inflata]|uniref:Uncharacterized protein n=1 Tax=Hexamita inflata TaxID=28002 RepID=A0ABP1GUS0_9EUKA
MLKYLFFVLSACPSSAPYLEASVCVALCSNSSFQVSGSDLVCVDSCVNYYVIDPLNLNQKQCVDRCPDDQPFAQTQQCVDRCSSASYSVVIGQLQSLVCQISCTYYVFNTSNLNSKQCLSTCPDATPYSDSGLCVERCSSSSYIVVSTQPQTHICQISCVYFVLNSTNRNSKQCLTHCPDSSPYSDSGACVYRCGSGSYQIVLGQTQTLFCQTTCTYFVLNATNGNSKQCLVQCEQTLPYSDSGLCSARCASGNYINQTGICTCLSSCSNLFIVNTSNLNSKECVDACPLTQVAYLKECIMTCPASAPYNDSSLCVTRCSSGIYSSLALPMQCVNSCSDMYVFNASNGNSQQCVNQCPSITPYYETGACMTRCSSGAYSVTNNVLQPLVCQASCTYYVFNASNLNSQQCLTSCPDLTPYSDSGLCAERCSTNTYMVVSGQPQTLICQASCTYYVLNASNANSHQCLAQCPDATPFSDSGLCVFRCSSGSYQSISGSGQLLFCVQACVYYIYNSSNANSKQCLSSCPSVTPYSDSGLCSSRCTSGNYKNSNNILTCQLLCSGLFIVNISNANSKQCVDSCPFTQVSYLQECVSGCPPAAPYNESSTCVLRCSTGVYSSLNINMLCVLSCPDIFVFNVSNQNSKQCITSCPTNTQFYEPGACVARCSSGAYSVTSAVQAYVCQQECSYFIYNKTNYNSKQCFFACPYDFPYSDNNMCVSSCASGKYTQPSSSTALVCQPMNATRNLILYIAVPLGAAVLILIIILIICLCKRNKSKYYMQQAPSSPPRQPLMNQSQKQIQMKQLQDQNQEYNNYTYINQYGQTQKARNIYDNKGNMILRLVPDYDEEDQYMAKGQKGKKDKRMIMVSEDQYRNWI